MTCCASVHHPLSVVGSESFATEPAGRVTSMRLFPAGRSFPLPFSAAHTPRAGNAAAATPRTPSPAAAAPVRTASLLPTSSPARLGAGR
jgi:hypothetical protein